MTKIKKIGKATIVNDEYVIKESNNSDIYEYLKSRNFNYFPNTKYEDRKEIQEYVKEIEYPQEQKFYDLINITSLLHSKTTYFKENETGMKPVESNRWFFPAYDLKKRKREQLIDRGFKITHVSKENSKSDLNQSTKFSPNKRAHD